MTNVKRPFHKRKGEQGFTLIELLVVIAVLSILAAIVIFNVTGVRNRGQAAACNADVKSVQSAVDGYVNDHPTDYNSATGLNVPNDKNAHTFVAAQWNLIVPNYIHTQPTGCTGAGGITLTNIAGDLNASNGYTVGGTP